MSQQDGLQKRWNLFARELERILAAHQLEWEQLPDLIGIDAEMVARLQYSLNMPGMFPLLDEDEMQLLTRKLQLNDKEIANLRASLLAISINHMLMGRIQQDDAHTIAEQIFLIVSRSLQEHHGELGNSPEAKRGDSNSTEDTTPDELLSIAQEATDNGTRSLQLSRRVSSHRERLMYAKQSLTYFQEALEELDDVDNEMRRLRTWNYWHNRALKGRTHAQQRIDELGG